AAAGPCNNHALDYSLPLPSASTCVESCSLLPACQNRSGPEGSRASMALLNRKNLRGKAAEEQARPAEEAAEEAVRVSAAVEILDLTSHWTKFVAFGGSSRVHGYADSGRIPRFAGMFLVRP